MTIFEYKNGIMVPKEKPKPPPKRPRPERPTQWDCPHCGEPYDTTKQENWEYTIGSIGPEPHIPHMICPKCDNCMGCSRSKAERDRDRK